MFASLWCCNQFSAIISLTHGAPVPAAWVLAVGEAAKLLVVGAVAAGHPPSNSKKVTVIFWGEWRLTSFGSVPAKPGPFA